jgi:putative aldouronate transport system permease protein
MAKATIGKGVKTKTTWANALKRDWQLYLLLMIPVALVVIFNYASYGGIRMVFMDYKPAKGYAGSKWVGWATFQKVFKDKDFIRALKSSIVFNLLDLAVGFPMPIILALILNELRFPRFKKVTQTILYLPHFLSWVIVGSVAYQMFRPTTGMVNVFLMNAGIIQNGIPFLTEKWHWAVTYLLIGVWQGMGWGTIIYLAAITAIDPSLYEAASIDGAGRWNKIKYVTLPGIKPTIMILLLMNVGNVLNAGFEIQYLLGNGLVQRVSQTIDIYVLKWGISQGDYAIGTAAGIFKSAVSIILIMIANQIAKRNGEERLF